MQKTIPIKEFRMNLANVADQVEAGESFIVIRRSKKAFKVVPIDTETDEQWETIVDFTEGGKKKGEKIEDVLKVLKKMNQKEQHG